ncbi:MAG TPA: TraR/DksA C4-type zinc finger protein [Gaiellaceae bacterium]|jgi:RNA polymerase-binding protein DksA|nr:TraR/DksA C4-type zinc finger protein [Gaiellaceae bacterium]
MTQVDVERFRTMLLEERERTVAAIEFLHEENPGSIEDETGEETQGDEHPADAATATYDRELDYSLEDGAENVLRLIDEALARIEAGTYGTCRVCGRDIGEERLEARPWTDLCIDDARRLGP